METKMFSVRYVFVCMLECRQVSKHIGLSVGGQVSS